MKTPKAKRRKIDGRQQSNYRQAEFEFVSSDIEKVPYCEHGPAILLERIKNGALERFYACAVCRSRKDCNFYRSFDDEKEHPMKEEKIRLVKKIMKTNRGFTHKNLYGRLKSYRKMAPAKRLFCSECSTLLVSADEARQHESKSADRPHKIVNGISNQQLKEPSKLLKLLTNEKKESQFMFSRDSLQFFGENIVQKFEFDGVLCLGAPRLMEFLQKKPYRNQCKSFMLDYDYRYAQFWSPRFFAQFNMFNGYFYTALGKKSFDQFLTSIKKLLIIVDPPYGGLISPIAQMLTKLKTEFEIEGGDCQLLLVSPYFMEQKICGALDGMTMLDYKVNYDGEIGLAPKDGSYIRVFTTLNPDQLELPINLGYRYCDDCHRYVASDNKHCGLCKACTSKDGHPYTHCSKCGKCVKSRYKHCPKCNHCHKWMENGGGCRSMDGKKCQICGQDGHIWIGCPKKIDQGEISGVGMKKMDGKKKCGDWRKKIGIDQSDQCGKIDIDRGDQCKKSEIGQIDIGGGVMRKRKSKSEEAVELKSKKVMVEKNGKVKEIHVEPIKKGKGKKKMKK